MCTTNLRLVVKKIETFNLRAETCGQVIRDLEWRLVDKGVDCGQESGALWTRELRFVDIFLLGIQTQYILPIVSNTLLIVQC